jgi:diguanylate cyclase (GGDEF)-like protein
MALRNFEAVVNTIDAGMILLDKDHDIIYMNKWLRSKSDIDVEDICGKNIFKAFPNIKEKSLKRNIKTTLTLDTASYYTDTKNNYIVPISLNNVSNKIFTHMQQSVTITPYDIDKSQVIIYIYDHTIEAEMRHNLNIYKKELENQLLYEQHRVYHDPLTKVYNRIKATELIEHQLSQFRKNHKHFSISIIDIDNFKNVNDTYGHLIGDEILINMAQVCQDSLTRVTDSFARWGGEEFVLLMPNTSVYDAIGIVEIMQNAINEIEHKTVGKVTASFGLTQIKINDTFETLFKRADDALYMAKSNGRDRYEIVV